MQDARSSIQSAYGRASDGERGWGCGPGGAVLGHLGTHAVTLRYILLVLVSESSTSVRGVRYACGVLCGSLLRSRPRLRSRSASGAAVRKLEGRRADNRNIEWGVVRDASDRNASCAQVLITVDGRWGAHGQLRERAFGRLLLLYGAAREYGR